MTSQSLMARTIEHLSQESTLESLCKHVSSGGSLPEYCRIYDIKYSEAAWWIQQDPMRKEAYKQAKIDRMEWMVEEVVGKLKDFTDITPDEYLNEDGSAKPISEWTQRAKNAMESYTVTESERSVKTSVKMHNKMKPVEMIGKFVGMFVDQVNITAEESGVDMIARVAMKARERKAKELESHEQEETENRPDGGAKHLAIASQAT